MRICILNLDTFGDMVLREPLFRTLIDAGHEVAVVVRTRYLEILPYIDPRLIPISTSLEPYAVGINEQDMAETLIELVSRIRAWGAEAIALPLYNRSSIDELVMSHFSDISRVGFSTGVNHSRSFHAVDELLDWTRLSLADDLFSVGIAVDELSHELDKYAELLTQWLGLKIDGKHPKLTLPLDTKTSAVHNQLASNGYAVSCPSGAMNVHFKAMPHEIAVAIGRRLFEKNGLITVFTGIELERDYLEKIAAELAEYGVPAQVWIGRQGQLQDLLSLIANSQLYFGADTGPMHFAAALDVPVLAIFGGGHYARFYPVARAGFIATQELGCFGCGWVCFRESAACIDFVYLPDVLAGLDRLLDGKIVGVEVHTGRLSKSEGQRQVNLLCQQERQQERSEFRTEIAERCTDIRKLEFELNEIRTSPLYLKMLKIRRSLLFRLLDKLGFIKR
jgi:ADP-heptose:LPS heptosyltransferase